MRLSACLLTLTLGIVWESPSQNDELSHLLREADHVSKLLSQIEEEIRKQRTSRIPGIRYSCFWGDLHDNELLISEQILQIENFDADGYELDYLRERRDSLASFRRLAEAEEERLRDRSRLLPLVARKDELQSRLLAIDQKLESIRNQKD